MQTLLQELTDAEIRYVGILVSMVTSRVRSAGNRIGAWHQLMGIFRTRFEGIGYNSIRHTLLESPVTRIIYTDADALLSRLIQREEHDSDLAHFVNTVGEAKLANLPAELGLDRFRAHPDPTEAEPTAATDSVGEFLTRQALDPQELEYFDQLDWAGKERVATAHLAMMRESTKPIRFRVMETRLPDRVKADILRKYNAALRPGPHGPISTIDPKFQTWVDQVLQIPLGVYRPMPVDATDSRAVAGLLADMRGRLDAVVKGQVRAKEALVEVVAACVSNPEYAGGSVLGLCGEPGVGKTSLVREGLASALDRPCIYVSLAGASETGHLGGFCFTFEGSRPGAFAQGVMRAGCMNPIFLLDEADKCSQRSVADLLCTVTDSSNKAFVDKFFADVELDLSKAMYVFCYNDRDAIDPVLRDRISEIQMDSFTPTEQVEIATDYLVPALVRELRMDPVQLALGALQHLSREYTPHVRGGVRPIRKALQRLLMRINILVTARSADPVGGGACSRKVLAGLKKGPITVDAALIDELLLPTGTTRTSTAPDMFM
jgi:hypothetical protein